MLLRIIKTGFFVIVSISILGQNTDELVFNKSDFNRKIEIAEWLFSYNQLAIGTFIDILENKPRNDNLINCICFQIDKNIWHVYWGKPGFKEFDLTYHYNVDTTYNFSEGHNPIGTFLLNRYSRALKLVDIPIDSINYLDLQIDKYIRMNEDSSFTVWCFPSTFNGLAFYGGEFIYTINQMGTKILEDNSYYQGVFRAGEAYASKSAQQELVLDYSELDTPTLGNIFFIMLNDRFFSKIIIENKHFNTFRKRNNDGTYSWIHQKK